ncbi:acetylornithine aminotransferase [Methanobrevibacter cuticularis]|uniref:Acetylornithine aminotransferase n=1 Tax=Methanobrevibacter cuticularis TaxID=47311 RepID=A0A166DSW2_9EURY|nr:acetylornithine transaminase [Methanobrevibacter cuticularis]KZX15918.1 acetylornithine aminotransferase [Methanobrevibacter cuticularis]
MNNKEIIDSYPQYIMNTYGRQPIALSHGKGTKVWDVNGKEYLDLFAGFAVNNIGHSHPRVAEAIAKQGKIMIHCSNAYYTEEQLKLAKLLTEISSHDKVFFGNSGAEANEAAIKLARKYTGKGEIIATENSFHGRTLATVTATGQDKYKLPFKPLPPGFKHVSYGDSDAIADAIGDKTAAVMLEPIQGEGGVRIPSIEYLKEVETICRDKGVLLIIDEVQTGFGRCGVMFASEISDVKPDITTTAKAIAGGFPMGAMLVTGDVATGFEPGDHGSTFGGSPLACSAAIASINVIIDEKLVENSKTIGKYFKNGLNKLKDKYDFIVDVRGHGLMLGLELSMEGAKIVDDLREKGFLINCTAEKVLRFVPPLILTKEEINTFLIALDETFSNI